MSWSSTSGSSSSSSSAGGGEATGAAETEVSESRLNSSEKAEQHLNGRNEDVWWRCDGPLTRSCRRHRLLLRWFDDAGGNEFGQQVGDVHLTQVVLWGDDLWICRNTTDRIRNDPPPHRDGAVALGGAYSEA